MDKWKKIWSVREMPQENINILEKLLILDGFDSLPGGMNLKEWISYNEIIKSKININSQDSVFEVGCGSGAFLYQFYNAGHKVGGLDYSETLVDIAREEMKNMNFYVSEAKNLSVKEKYDFVVSFGVFHYFPNLEYAEEVINKMLEKSNKSVVIFDIPDLALKEESENERKMTMPEGEYEKKYKGLEHLFFHKDWFNLFADKYNCSVNIFNQVIDGYPNSKFRFNVILHKL